MKKFKIRFVSFISCFIITFLSVCSPVLASESNTPVFDGLSFPKQAGIVLMSYPDLVKLSFKSLGAVITGNPVDAVNTMMQYPATVEELAKLTSDGKLQKGTSGTYYSPVTKDASGYKIPSELVNESKVMLDRYVQETDGYYIVPVDSPDTISVGLFRTQSFYTETMNYFKSHPDDVFLNFDYSEPDYFNMFNLTPYMCYCTGTTDINTRFQFSVLNPDWSTVTSVIDHKIPYGATALHLPANPVISTNDQEMYNSNQRYTNDPQFNFFFGNSNSSGFRGFLFSQNTRFIKIFKNTDAIKNYAVGKQSVYTSTTYNNLKTDNSVDNSVHISDNDLTIDSNNVATTSNTFTTYNSTSVTNITNNVTNNTGISPEQMQELIDSIVKTNSINSGSSSGTGASTSGNSSGSSSGSSGGVSAIVGAIGKLLDVIAMIAGKVVSAFADFIASILKSLDSFTGLTTGFTNFLTGIFAFIPPDVMAIITTGITISILISVIKLLRR